MPKGSELPKVSETELQRFAELPDEYSVEYRLVYAHKENTHSWEKKHSEGLEVTVLGASSRLVITVPTT